MPPILPDVSTRENKIQWLVVAISVLGAGLILWQLGSKSLWMDEVTVAVEATGDLANIPWETLKYAVPPLHYFVVHYFVSILGETEFAIRLPSAIFGILSIPLIYKTGRCLFGRYEGVLGAYLLAISPFYVEYSQEGRTYTLWIFFTLLSIYFFVQAIRKDNPVAWIGYTIATALAMYTNFLSFFVILTTVLFVGLLILIRSRAISRQTVPKFIFSFTAMVVLYIPQLVIMSTGRLNRGYAGVTGLITDHGVSSALITLIEFLANGFQSVLMAFSPTWLVPFALLFLMGLILSYYDEPTETTLLFLWITVYPSLVLLFLLNRSFFHPRYFIICLPVYLLLVSRGAVWLMQLSGRFPVKSVGVLPAKPQRITTLAAFFVIFFFFGLSVSPLKEYYSQEKQNYRDAARYIEQNLLPGDSIIIGIFDGLWLEYYFASTTREYNIVRSRSIYELESLTGPNNHWC
jgi:uncharacterized membrane protein